MHDIFQNRDYLRKMILAMFKATSRLKLFEIFKVSTVDLEQSGYDNWDGGTTTYDVTVKVPAETYFFNKDEMEGSSQSIFELVKNVVTTQGEWAEIGVTPTSAC